MCSSTCKPAFCSPGVKISRDPVNSSIGFAWGYNGSGPAQLAPTILTDYFEVKPGVKRSRKPYMGLLSSQRLPPFPSAGKGTLKK
jgi:hypothetical protein